MNDDEYTAALELCIADALDYLDWYTELFDEKSLPYLEQLYKILEGDQYIQ